MIYERNYFATTEDYVVQKSQTFLGGLGILRNSRTSKFIFDTVSYVCLRCGCHTYAIQY